MLAILMVFARPVMMHLLGLQTAGDDTRLVHNLSMRRTLDDRWWPRLAGFLTAALAAGSAVFWLLQLSALASAQGRFPLPVPSLPAPDPIAIARVLGGGKSPVAASASVLPDANAGRFKLSGVVASKQDQGLALIAIDGKPARPIKVGGEVGEALLLQTVSRSGATLAPRLDGPATVTLELPKPAVP
jgi:general secretion pathway protein C